MFIFAKVSLFKIKIGYKMASQSYIVGPGDTLGRIAQKFGVSPLNIAKASNLANINKISLNQKLTIPVNRLENIVSVVSNQSIDSNKPCGVNKQGFVTGMDITKDQATNLEHGSLKKVNAIVLHRTASPSFQKPKGSTGAHFFILKNGEIRQTASLNKETWHVGKIRSKCMVNNSCSPQDAKKLKSFGWSPSKIHSHEKGKPYTDRYPTNSDSVGIEVVGDYHEKTKTWDAVTENQKTSVNKLVNFLEKEYGLEKDDRYNHEDVSYKKDGEGSTVETIVVD